ncbi:hypothetical protein SAMN05444955_105236 [Lihuaxuella thermophila]|uniref:Uncharacterized protein n=1 Tax=Lihuaxuella thermophila TaxID=1173111 RepID=A0A1H8DKN2_9BACL|nr:hypothetical protein SAMN05444955_105236 [Lihuaxuella thermophila]
MINRNGKQSEKLFLALFFFSIRLLPHLPGDIVYYLI